LITFRNLYSILGDIIREIYNQNVSSRRQLKPDQLFSKVLKLEQDLARWKQELPAELRLIKRENLQDKQVQSLTFSRLPVVLTLRYLNVRVLLHRAVLAKILDDIEALTSTSDESSFLNVMGHVYLRVCVDSAMEIIELTHAFSRRPDILPAWWFAAYFGKSIVTATPRSFLTSLVFNAALIIFGAVVVQSKGSREVCLTSNLQLVQCLQKALEALENIGKETRLVRRCSKYLVKLIQISSSIGESHDSAIYAESKNLNLTRIGGGCGLSDVPKVAQSNGQYGLSSELRLSSTDESTVSPLDMDFGQFLIDGDFEFLDLWTDMAQPLASSL
jgi:hypothetical protein